MFGPSILFNVSKLLNDCHVMEHFLRGSPLFPGLCISARAGASQIVQQRSEIFLGGAPNRMEGAGRWRVLCWSRELLDAVASILRLPTTLLA